MLQTKVLAKLKTHFMFKNVFSPENRAPLMCSNMVEPDRPQIAIMTRRICCSCQI